MAKKEAVRTGTDWKRRVKLFLKDADRIGRVPLSIWLAWGLFAYMVLPFMNYYIFKARENTLGPSLSFYADSAAFAFFYAYKGAFSLLLALFLSFYGGWRAVKKYGISIRRVAETGIFGGLLMGTVFVGGTILLRYNWWQNDVLLAGTIFIVFAISTAMLCLFLALFSSIGAFAAKEVE